MLFEVSKERGVSQVREAGRVVRHRVGQGTQAAKAPVAQSELEGALQQGRRARIAARVVGMAEAGHALAPSIALVDHRRGGFR